MPATSGAEVIVDKKKVTKRLGAEELEKRKAPFASPIVNREGEGRTGGGGIETSQTRDPGGDRIDTQGPLPKPPIVHR
jgi:hypothetical protein